MSTRKRESRHRQNLRMRYKKNLLEAAFEEIPLDDPIREGYLWEWEKIIFGKEMTPRPLQEDRWVQCYAVDHFTAGKCLRWLIQQFLSDPRKKAFIEAACFLWILIWAGHEKPYTISGKEVLYLTMQQISLEGPVIEFTENKHLEISHGLHILLLCLRGKGVRLFKNLKNEKKLERIFHDMSKALGIPLVLPTAFCSPCHPYIGNRIPEAQLKAMQNTRKLIPNSARKRRDEIKAFLKKTLREASHANFSPN